MAYGKIKADSIIYDNSGSDVEKTIASLAAAAPTNNPTFTGTVTIPTPSAGDDSTKAASTAYVVNEFSTKASPTFTGTVTIPTPTAGDNSTKAASTAFVVTSFATKASPTFTGTVTIPTASANDSSTKAASTAFVMTELADYAPLAAPAFTGNATGANLTLSGNLTVNGTTTTVATTNTTVTDNLLELNSGASSNANDAGILIERGSTGDNAIIAWDESADRFTLGTTTATNDATGNISVSTGTLAANVVGNVTGNVTGNTSGSSGSCTGNAATATALATARTIGGSSFDGTANITVDAATLDGIDSAGFLRSDTSDVASEKITFSSNATNNYDDIATATTGQGGIEIYNQGVGNDAFMAFHSGSDYAVYFGLDADSNSLAVGGWSMGAVKHKIIHQGNVGSGDALSGLTVYTSAVHDSKGDLRTIPQNSKTSAYTLVAADAGKHITTNSGVTIPASVFSAGEAITIVNNSGSSITLTQGSSLTMYNTNDGNTGNRTLALRGMATILFTGATECHISGGGLT